MRKYILYNDLGKWYAAFIDKWYKDYVIDFSVFFNSKEDAIKAIESGKFEPEDDDDEYKTK